MHLRPACLAILAGLTFASSAWADGRVVQPGVLRAIRTGITDPSLARAVGPRPGSAPVIIELDRAATPADLQAIRKTGARLRTANGRLLAWSRFVPADVTEASVQALPTVAHVKRVALAPAAGPRPMDLSAKLMGLQAARGARPALDLLTGQGVVVADLDSNAEVFHPQFFRADAGWFDWIDVDKNGMFEPEIDAIDLDRDGKASAGETARWQKTQTMYTWYGNPVKARSTTFDPAIDWLYLDENDNKRRDYGKADGFDDTAPAFGEPLFVPDDVNRNGKLDVGERVARLGTSKFKKVFVRIEYWGDIDHVFERGVDLTAHENNYTNGLYGMDEAMHGTAVLSIIAGDVPLVGRRWVGIAPDADLLLGYELGTSTNSALTWAMAEKPDVMLHELAPWADQPLDGSDPYSTMVDESATKDNVAHSCPTGNNGGMRKHAHVALAAGATQSLAFNMPSFQGTRAQYLQIGINVRGATSVGVKVSDPDGGSVTLDKAASGKLPGGCSYYGTLETSPRGTYFVNAMFNGEGAAAPALGGWTVELTGNAQTAATVDAYLYDDQSTWALGAAWDPSIASDDSTIGYPSTADTCIAIGAHTGHPKASAEPWFTSGPEAEGELRNYSGRGPRIDGVQKPDIAAPDNPWAAAPHIVDGAYGDTPFGGVWPFGGTSGAGPHVTGVTALLAQAGIKGDAAREAIRTGAIHDAKTGATPNMRFGWGRLSAAGALGAVAEGEAPTVSLTAKPAGAGAGEQVTLEPVASDSDGAASELEAKWDDDYDGTWDTGYGPVQARTISKKSEAPEPFKVRVRDKQGRIAEAVVWVGGPPAPDADAGPDGSDDDASTEFPEAAPASDDGGCGCRARTGERHALAGLLAIGLMFLRRRRS
jgi:hypothetical protein